MELEGTNAKHIHPLHTKLRRVFEILCSANLRLFATCPTTVYFHNGNRYKLNGFSPLERYNEAIFQPSFHQTTGVNSALVTSFNECPLQKDTHL
jgi:hypothetical protein